MRGFGKMSVAIVKRLVACCYKLVVDQRDRRKVATSIILTVT